MWSLAGLSASDLINEGFAEKMYGRFAGPKKSGRNTEVVLRRGSTVVFSLILPSLWMKSCDLIIQVKPHQGTISF